MQPAFSLLTAGSSTSNLIAMRRRDFVKAIVIAPAAAKEMLGQAASVSTGQKTSAPQSVSTAAAPPLPQGAPRSFNRQGLLNFDVQPITTTVADAVASTDGNFFTKVQMETLIKLSDVLMPPLNDFPGALQAGAPEFLDFLIGASPLKRKHMYQTGLDWLDASAKQQFGIPFSRVNAEQADKLIRPWLRTWMTDHPPTAPHEHFINVAHQDIRTATMNSQMWSIAATSVGERAPGIGLYWSPIDPDIQRYV